MFAVAEINYIRHEANVKGTNYTELGENLEAIPGQLRNTQKKRILVLKQRRIQKRPSPVMGPFKHIVDEWLKEDSKQKKKFRRTAKRIWD